MGFTASTENTYVSATSYVSLAEAEELLKGEKDFSTWQALSEDVKKAVLNKASLAVDGIYSYQGMKTDTLQLLKFPRDKEKTIPTGVKIATALLGFQVYKDEGMRNVTEERIGKMAWTFYKTKHGLSEQVLTYLEPFIMRTVKLNV